MKEKEKKKKKKVMVQLVLLGGGFVIWCNKRWSGCSRCSSFDLVVMAMNDGRLGLF